MKVVVKALGLNEELQLKLMFSGVGEGSGIPGVAWKCVDIRKNTNSVGRLLGRF